MKALFSERTIVIVLFIAALITFSLAQEDTRKIEKLYSASAGDTAAGLVAHHSGK